MEYIERASWAIIGVASVLWLFAFISAYIDYVIINSNYNNKYYRFNNALNRLQETRAAAESSTWQDARAESEKLTWYALFMFYAEHSHKMKNDEEMDLFADGYFTRLEKEVENKKAF